MHLCTSGALKVDKLVDGPMMGISALMSSMLT
jgi:hypothetical protein